MNTAINNPWGSYTDAVLGILNIVKQTIPMTGVQQRRIAEAEELVQAAADIIAIEEESDPDEDEDHA